MPTNLPEDLTLCHRVGAAPSPPAAESHLGMSAAARTGAIPLHGLRHPPDGSSNGWFIWAGEYSDDPDFFQPTCVHHIPSVLPVVLPYLALPPGWRFLLAPGHEDVWFDPRLLIPAP
jgi:hypothetical protein